MTKYSNSRMTTLAALLGTILVLSQDVAEANTTKVQLVQEINQDKSGQRGVP